VNEKPIRKGLLIFPIYTDLSKTDAIVIKNEGIRKGFYHNGVAVDVLRFNVQGIFNADQLVFPFRKGKLLRSVDLYFRAWKQLVTYAVNGCYDLVWLRLPLINPAIAGFVKELKKKNPACKIILEYGAYPFENELSTKARWYYKLNRSSEKLAHQYADFVITYCGQEYVDNLVNIPIDNGIDLEKIGIVHPDKNLEKGINLIAVSSLKKWHAYERLVAGLPAYVKAGHIPVHFHIVGDGPEMDKIRNLVQELNVNDAVSFHGFKGGRELDAIYNQCHIAIGTLGFHRIGITNSSSLKNREYFARGLPIVLSTTDKDMPATLPYVLYLPEGESPVDVAAIVAFAKRVYTNANVNEQIRDFAEKQVSWNSKIKTVLSYLENKNTTHGAIAHQSQHN
jgi:glycosyltransferase involved in cell wall biosynthesis